jgi:hypothetical protein
MMSKSPQASALSSLPLTSRPKSLQLSSMATSSMPNTPSQLALSQTLTRSWRLKLPRNRWIKPHSLRSRLIVLRPLRHSMHSKKESKLLSIVFRDNPRCYTLWRTMNMLQSTSHSNRISHSNGVLWVPTWSSSSQTKLISLEDPT